MFGNPEHFQAKDKKILIPRNVFGWLFYGGWTVAIVGPCMTMLAMGKYIEMAVWFVVAGIWFTIDFSVTSRKIQRRVERNQLFFVGESKSHVSTKKYDLNLRGSNSTTTPS